MTIEKTVGDVIGPPHTWPSYRHGGRPIREELLKGAVVAEVAIFDDGILLATAGAVCGPTFAEFRVDDRRLRERIYAAMRVGTSVEEAVAALV